MRALQSYRRNVIAGLGHCRGSPGIEKEIVYIVQTDAGQEVLAPDAFAKKYGWKNDPQRVRLPRSTVP
jgi:hypothetical protein